jgi:two-component system chemotaxis response regulator CheB
MPPRVIRVLVVDDSALIREIICDFLRAAPGIEVAGTARDGKEALSLLETLRPDVVTLDVQMPNMNGLETLAAILERNPVPVIMVSSLTQIGANITLEALERGALDYVAKPESGAEVEVALNQELIRKIRAMAGTDVRRMLQIRKERASRVQAGVRQLSAAPEKNNAPSLDLANKCIAIGISTGGPPALTTLFQALQTPLPPIVVVQHMPQHFTKPFAWRLNSISRLEIKEGETGDILQPNHVYIAPGGKHLSLQQQGGQVKIQIRDGDPVSGHKPSVDVMMKAAAQIYGSRCLGVVMTGMGRDGSDGCKEIRARGGYVLGQDEASSDVYGMNKVAQVEGNVDRQFGLDEAATVINQNVKRLWGRETPKLRAVTV